MMRCEKNSVANRFSRRSVGGRIGAIALIGAVLPLAPCLALGQDTPKATDGDEIQQLVQSNRQVLQQIQELQARVSQLEAKLSEAASTSPGGRSVSAGSATGTPKSGPATAPAPEAMPQHSDPVAPAVQLHMFGDMGYEASDEKGTTNSFRIGSLDLFMTGILSDRVSVLGEVLFIPQKDNSIGVDVERLLLQYKRNDYFAFNVGRYHSSIGYYNTAFHQGAWFQTAVDRPFMYAFDDQGGFLPLQEVGISINGQIPSGQVGLNYVAEMGNGRNHLLGLDPAQNRQDTNNGKSVNFALFARPDRFPGLQAGFSIYHDDLTFSDNDNQDELISTVHVVYVSSNYEFLSEGMLVRHDRSVPGSAGVFHTPGFYTQVSRRFGRNRPYFRYAYVNAAAAEPVYGDPEDGPVVGRRNGPSVGLRFDFNEHAAVKLQYDHLDRRGHPSSNGLQSQFSFAF